GQQSAADARTSGSKLDCPTCFQEIIVPQAPASGSSNLILSASQVGKPRPVQMEIAPGAEAAPVRRMSFVSLLFWAGLVIVAAGGIFIFRERIVQMVRGSFGSDSKAQLKRSGRASYPVPTNFSWTLNVNNMIIPESTAAGGIRGQGFMCEQATLQGGNLTLRQGRARQPDLGITVQLFAKEGEELSRKTVQVGPERPPPIPTI